MKNGLSCTLPISGISVGLFKQLIGLHPRWVLPAARGDGHLDHLDRLPSMSQHHLRHLWVDAAAACHLPSYVIAFLKGDVVKADGQEMVAHYLHDLGDHAAPNAISEKIEQKCRCLPVGACFCGCPGDVNTALCFREGIVSLTRISKRLPEVAS